MKGMAKRWWIAICGVFAAICLAMSIGINVPAMQASAASETPTVTMVAGASVRKTVGEPGIKFTAKIDNYNSSYDYGMLILPENAWTKFGWNNDTDYIAYLEAENVTNYANNPKCGVYLKDGERFISFSLTEIYPYNYDMSFVGVAYTLKDGVYNYADVDVVENGRSIAYVAQMALMYEDGLTEEHISSLNKFVNASNIQIDKEDYWKDPNAVVGGTTEGKADNYAAKRDFNVSEAVSFITKTAYAGGSEVSFKYYLPAGTTDCGWWGIAWHTDASKADNYHAAGVNNAIGYQALGATLGVWTDVSFALPAGGPYYLYFGSEVDSANRWKLDGGSSYALIDDFKVGATTESFTSNINDSIFNANAGVVSSYLYEQGEVSFGEAPGEYSAKIVVDKVKSDAGTPTFVTKESYPAGSVVKFKYYIPSDVKVGTWAYLCCVGNPTSGDIYANWLLNLPITTGQWIEKEVTLTSAGYLYFAADVGQWGDGEGYILIDDFSITSNGDTVTDNFNNNVSGGLFNVNTEDAVVSGEGYVYVEKELAMKFIPNEGDAVSAITKTAYAAGSTVSFKYYIPAGTTTSWWGIAWHTNAGNADNYHAAGINANYVGHEALGATLGAWTDVSFTLPASGGPYYLYFGSECGSWKLNGENSYILIDNFTVNDETDTFNGGFENSLFNVNDANRTTLSEDGEGYTNEVAPPEEIGEVAMKYIFNASGESVSQVTKQAYAGGSTVSFKYYIPAGTATKWWGIVWSTKNTGLDIYAAASNASAYPLGATLGEWTDVAFTLPSGGPYYLYFGSEVGNWKLNGDNAYVFIDDFTVNGETETFNYGVENSIFNVLVAGTVVNSEDGEGFIPLYGEFGAKLNINTISSEASQPSFITASKYAGGVTVTFDYYMSGNTNDKWWSFNWTTNNTVASIYAFVENNPNQQGQALPTVQDSWQTVSVEIPAGEWYFYFGGAVGEWGNGYVIIDNFKIGDTVTETFNNGEYGIFLNNTPDAITIADGNVTEVIPDEPIEESDDPYALVNLLKDESKLSALLENGGFAWLASNGVIDATNMPASRLLVEGYISFTITGEKEFAIYFGNGVFIFVDNTIVAVYNGTTKVGEMNYTAQGETKLYLTITADGKLNLRVGEDGYKGFGKVAIDGLMMKIVAMGGTGIAKFTEVNVDTYKCVNYVENAPVYASDETIDFTAYSFDSDNMVSEEGFRLLSEAGFTKTLGLLQGRSPSDDLHEQVISGNESCTCGSAEAHVQNLMKEVNADAMAAIELAEKFGMKHYVLNSNIYNIERDPDNYEWLDEFADQATYTMSKAFAGHFLADEPQSGNWFTDDELGELVNAYKAYRAAFPEGEAFINLLPRDSSQFTSESLYEDYIDEYIETIALEYNGVPGTGYVSFDHYPLKTSSVTSTHLRNLELVAEKCRDKGLELRIYIKASESGDDQRSLRATESINDLYMQIYSGLAYGAKEIVYYQFTDHRATDGTAGDGVISGTSLAVNNLYTWTKQANNEVHALGAAYMNFTWQSASVFGSTGITQFNNLKSKASAYGYISSVSSSASVLVGNFARNTTTAEQNGDNYAYMVVNYGDTNGATTATTAVNITFNGTPKKALVYQGGKATVVTLSSNVLTLNLMLGEGAFVIPFI